MTRHSNEKREPWSVTNRKTNTETHKHDIFALTAVGHSTIFPKLCTVIELIDSIKKTFF